MTSTTSATLFDRLESVPRAERLESGGSSMTFLELLENNLRLGLVRVGTKLLELGGHVVEKLLHLQRSESHRDGLGEEREKSSLVDGVVENLRLEFLVADLELTSNGGVPNGDGESLLRDVRGVGHHGGSSLQKRSVGELSERRFLYSSVSSDLGVLHEHVRSRNSNVRELTARKKSAFESKRE